MLEKASSSRSQALRMVESAAGARRDLSLVLIEHMDARRLTRISGIGSELLSTIKAAAVAGLAPDKREAHLYAILEATLADLMITNEALTDMATVVANQLVGEPGKLISGGEIAKMLDVTEEAVRQRLQSGKLIAVLGAGRERGRGFPIFQAWAGIAGAPLEQILKALAYEGPGKSVDAADAFQFFVNRNDLLGNFTPVEVLTGAGLPGPDDVEAAEFLAMPHQKRLEFVTSVARSLAAARNP